MSKINVLIVEDEAIVSKDIQQSLKRLGYNVVGSSATGECALQLVHSEHPDIVLMDIMLKGKKGTTAGPKQLSFFKKVLIVTPISLFSPINNALLAMLKTHYILNVLIILRVPYYAIE